MAHNYFRKMRHIAYSRTVSSNCMIKKIFIHIIYFLPLVGLSQNTEFSILLDSGKVILNQRESYSDYEIAVNILEQAVELNPSDSEARYFLGYAYSRLNSPDGASIPNIRASLTQKSSQQFEKIIQGSTPYTGELIILDPYSKITSEWGSLALHYLYQHDIDSVKFALTEGKKRGGFSDMYLELARLSLKTCSKNSILFTTGDNVTFPLIYLQIIDNYRTDVSVINVDLLESIWYPNYLSGLEHDLFKFNNSSQDSISYSVWSDSLIKVNNYSWTIKPSYEDSYLLRKDLILLSILKSNEFKRTIYFSKGFEPNSMLSLNDLLTKGVFNDQLTFETNSWIGYSENKKQLKKLLTALSSVNKYSIDELESLDYRRIMALSRVKYLISIEQYKQAETLLNIIDKDFNESNYPFQKDSQVGYINYLRTKILLTHAKKS